MKKSFLFYEDDSLCFGEKSIRLADFAARAEGPVYVYHLGIAESRFREMKDALPPAHLHYALKANSHPQLLRRLKQAGAGADVVSGGEIRRALECGFAPADIIYSGVGKTEKEITLALDVDIAQFNVESLPELERIGEIARRRGQVARVGFRLNPDVDINTHKYIATGLAENKFGMELSLIPRLEEVLAKFAGSLRFQAVSLHLGSQMLDLSGLREGLRRLKPVFRELRGRHEGLNIFDAGGGLGIHYQEDKIDAESALLRQYAALIREELGDLGAELQFEPGRWIVAHAGVLLTQVQYVKETSQRTFVIVDTGMNHLIRPALYEAHHRILPLRVTSKSQKVYDVVGPICESADFLAKERGLPPVNQGDWLAIADSGAYGFSMSNTYNLQDLPREIVVG
ncbi:MAG: diaminopimelate decarboxylase [Bdellovibrionaceae bacterium]|nr:diaminopimelate decarboxylase [Pseudobdellovibrionaceae bacterium]